MTGPVIVGAPGPGALTLGRRMAEWLGAPLVVAVTHPAPHPLGSGRVDVEWVADRRQAAREALDEARDALAGAGCEVDLRMIASSSAAHGLHDLAEQTGAAMIVVAGSREAGSTADRLLAGSVCPVAVAPPDRAGDPAADRPGPPGLIGVAYVDTPDGRAALAEAAGLARRTGAPLRLYTVVAEGGASRPFLLGDDTERAYLETARETYELALTRAVEAAPDVVADWRLVPGAPVTGLAGLTEVDVLYCGSRGYGPARRVLLGGVSARLVRQATRPVVVVPRSG